MWADTATGLQDIEAWLDAHPALLSLIQKTGSVVGGAMWLKNLTPVGLVSYLVTNYGYHQVLKLLDGNIEVAKTHLTTYFTEHDKEITPEQASYLADCAMKVLQTAGQIAVHQVAARKFDAVRNRAKPQTRQGGIGKKSGAKGSGGKIQPVKDAYELAKTPGCKHHSTYNQYRTKTPRELNKGIRSFQRRIDEHRDKLANPQKYDPRWHTYTKDHQLRQLRGWEQEIKNFTEEKNIFEGILKNRE